MTHSFLQWLEGFSWRVRDDGILNLIMVQDLSLTVVVSVLASNVPASSWTRWCATHFATCSGVRWSLDKVTGGPLSMLCTMAVIAVPASSGCLSLDPRWGLLRLEVTLGCLLRGLSGRRLRSVCRDVLGLVSYPLAKIG